MIFKAKSCIYIKEILIRRRGVVFKQASFAILLQIIFILVVFKWWHYLSLCRTYKYVGSKSCFMVGKIPSGEFLLVLPLDQ